MRAFGSNFPDFRAIWLGTTKPKLQNRYGAADQNIQMLSNLLVGYLWLTRTSWIGSTPSEPSNSSQSSHTGTNVASFRPNEHVKKGGNHELPIFGNFGRGIFHFCSSLGQNSGATDSGRPVLHLSTNIVFANIWENIHVGSILITGNLLLYRYFSAVCTVDLRGR